MLLLAIFELFLSVNFTVSNILMPSVYNSSWCHLGVKLSCLLGDNVLIDSMFIQLFSQPGTCHSTVLLLNNILSNFHVLESLMHLINIASKQVVLVLFFLTMLSLGEEIDLIYSFVL